MKRFLICSGMIVMIIALCGVTLPLLGEGKNAPTEKGVKALSSVAESALTLADSGRTDYVILLPENATPVQTTAARELASYLKEISGADFPIETETPESADPAKKQLVIGPSATSQALLDDAVNEDSLEYDAIVIKRVGDSIVFSGHPKRGPLYAVDTFLEETLGCRWWTASESFIPKLDKVVVSDFDKIYAPKLINRESFYKGVIGAGDFTFAAHLKCNGHYDLIQEEYGGHQNYLYFVHSFYSIISPMEFEEHPDWFPEIDGVRKVGYSTWVEPPQAYKEMVARLKPEQVHSSGTQLCLTNEELFQVMLKRVLEAIKNDPSATIVSISQNDWQGYCECEKCRAIAEEEGSQSGPILRFVNRMAEEIGKVYPDIYVDTLAYQYSRKPPKITHARDNVIVRLCSIECSCSQSLAEGEQNATFREDMEGWCQMADHIFVWDYMTDFRLYLLPFPNYRVWADNINFFVDHHTVGLFEQGDYEAETGDFVQLRAWVVAKLLWDPKLDQRELMKEFIAGYYAPELVPIYLDYFDLLSDCFESTGQYLGIYRPIAHDWIDLDTLLKASALQDKALAIAKDLEAKDPEKYAGLVFKVRRERIPIDLVWLMGYPRYSTVAKISGVKDFPTVEAMRDLAEDFNDRLDQSHVTTHAEGVDSEDFTSFKEDLVKRYSSPMKEITIPEICRNLPANHWVDIQTDELALAYEEELVFVEDDPKASDGETIRMPSTHHEWVIQCPLNNFSNVRPYVSVRVEAADGGELPEGELFQIGVYHLKERKNQIETKTVTRSDLAGSDYSLIDLGEFPCDPFCMLWIAPIERTENPINIFVDRIILTF